MIDSTGKTLDKVMTGQQVQIVSDVTNKVNKDQSFAYLVQIQDSNGITLSLSWITGSLLPDQNMSLSPIMDTKNIWNLYCSDICVARSNKS
ncbi:hypothetical protein DYY67_0010 [Candidatus Nitrosotalea sp. TS]|uniref:hypothetical protein n=1 Tax=Candidatus Nitrosotalea sp. TS TaxID=2341020 RepID=UPI00140D08B2|nr:hypothetical protein [Candidatus Nitrosotalea sp. TS]NHI02889.1 hypothetical protein [Candidatus Nitrosotalea sp. TS]